MPSPEANNGVPASDLAASKLLTVIAGLMVELHPHLASRQVLLDDALDKALGFDSLSRLELLARIERAFGVALPERLFAQAETPRDLLRAVLQAGDRASRLDGSVADRISLDFVEPAPDHALTLVEVLEWHVRHHPDRPHIQLYSDDGAGEAITYQALLDGARALAGGLQQRGLQPGESVTIMLPTGPDYFYSFFGILLAGGVPVPIYPPVRSHQLEDHLRRQVRILNSCQATILISVEQALLLTRLLKPQVESLRDVLTAEQLLDQDHGFQAPSLEPGDIAFLQYTSGSTGSPKGVVLTHANLLANIRADGRGISADATDVFVSWLPLYHDMGLIGAWLGSLYFAILLVIMSPLQFLARPSRWFRAIHHYGGTLSAAPNFAYELCLSRVSDDELVDLDLRNWRIAFNGAEPVSPRTIREFQARFGAIGFRRETMFPVFGLAECSVGLAFPPPGRGPLIDQIDRTRFLKEGIARPVAGEPGTALEFVACGQPIEHHEIRVVDSGGRELPERQEGRLEFRGPSATSGYFRNQRATERLFDGDWLDSGDLAYIAAGDLYITGRSKDVIIRAGRNIYPHELEEAIGNLAGIRKARVVAFGATDTASGTEKLVVIAETRTQDSASRERLRAEIQALTSDLIGLPPDDVVLARPGTVLKTSSGKIRRAACRQLYEQGELEGRQKALWLQLTHLAMSALGSGLRTWMRRLASVVSAVGYWALFLSLLPPAWLLVILLPGRETRYRAIRFFARVLLRLSATPLRITGLEHLLTEGPVVVVCNHASYLDAIVLTAAIPGRISFVAKAEFQRNPFAGIALRRAGVQFVDRYDKQKGLQDARRLGQLAGQGESLCFFPEGKLSRRPGVAAFHMGAFVAAAEAGVPVVPVALRGTRSMLRSGSWFPRRGVITLNIGASLGNPADGADNADTWRTALSLRDQARTFILEHSGEPDLEPGSAPAPGS